MRLRPGSLAIPCTIGALIGALAACFDGLGIVGAVCHAEHQCAADQRCVNSVCGLCRNRVVDPGELCFGSSSEENVFGEVTELLAYDAEGDGFAPLLIATVNTNCMSPPMAGPPAPNGSACWQAYGMIIDESDGDFEVTNILSEGLADGRIPQATTGDFDGLNTMDLALAIVPNDQLIDQTQLIVAHDLALTDGGPILTQLDISLRANTLHAADLDGDGLDDLLVGGEITSSLVTFISSPGVGFQNERLQVIEDPAPRPAPPVDMDGDGDLDIVLVSPVDSTLSVYANNGQGLFALQRRTPVSTTHVPLQLATGDIDVDGNTDVVVLLVPADPDAGLASELHVYRNTGTGELELDQVLPGGELPVSALVTDLTGDGLPDIVVADILEDKLPVHINRSGEFPDFVTIDVAASPRELMLADFDFDSIPDLVIGNANGVVAIVPAEN